MAKGKPPKGNTMPKKGSPFANMAQAMQDKQPPGKGKPNPFSK